MINNDGIQDQNTYVACNDLINNLDNVINQCYNELKKTSEDDNVQISKIQALIDYYKTIILALSLLCQAYVVKSKNNKKIQIYKVKKGDTLPLISQAFYGNMEFWKQLYNHNNLETTILNSSMELEIPIIHPQQSKKYASEYVNYIESTVKE